jgi:hypothetical protein
MTESLHPAASHHLPMFITAPGETDVFMVVMAVILVLAVLAFGILFLRLHTLPERMAHKGHKLQFEIVAVLGLIALFTHMHIFWIAALLLAMIDIPDFGGSLSRIAGSTEKIAGLKPGEGLVDLPEETIAAHEERAHEPQETVKPRESATVVPARPGLAAAGTRS